MCVHSVRQGVLSFYTQKTAHSGYSSPLFESYSAASSDGVYTYVLYHETWSTLTELNQANRDTSVGWYYFVE